MSAAIRTENLGKTYVSPFLQQKFVGLEGLNLEVPQGTAFGFVGPNGAGKTTTIKILMGIQSSTSGRAWIHGRDVPHPDSRRSVGFLPERPYFYEHLTAEEFLDFYAQLNEIPSRERAGAITTLLERVDLARFRKVQLGKFSKGMLQRAGLAQALLGDPSLLVLDEPMSGLDPIGRALVRDIMMEEKRAGKTVFFSSHVLSDIEAICDQAAIVVRGKLRGQGTIASLLGETLAHVECVFRVSLPPSAFPEALSVEAPQGGALLVRLPPEAVDAAIDRVRAAKGAVLQVTPVQRSLEKVLLDEVERAQAVDQKTMGVLT